MRVTATRAETDPKVFTQLHYHYVVKGAGLKAAAVERAIKLSSEKYCSASIMLGHTAAVSHSCEIVDTAAQETL